MTPRDLTITILGSGTSTGVPVVGCSCEVCTSTSPRNMRTRCSILLSYGGKNVLVDTSTDLRQQALREGLSRIDAVFYTHTHADHVNGIDDLRPFNLTAGAAIPIFGSPQTIAVIRHNFGYIFDVNPDPGYRPRLIPREITGPFDLFDLRVEPLALIHGSGPSLGYRLGAFAYLTDCSEIPPETERLLQDLDVLVIDALRFRPHTTHFNIAGALAAARRLKPRRTLLTHLSHDVDYHRHGSLLPPGTELAFDGQRLRVHLAEVARTGLNTGTFSL